MKALGKEAMSYRYGMMNELGGGPIELTPLGGKKENRPDGVSLTFHFFKRGWANIKEPQKSADTRKLDDMLAEAIEVIFAKGWVLESSAMNNAAFRVEVWDADTDDKAAQMKLKKEEELASKARQLQASWVREEQLGPCPVCGGRLVTLTAHFSYGNPGGVLCEECGTTLIVGDRRRDRPQDKNWGYVMPKPEVLVRLKEVYPGLDGLVEDPEGNKQEAN
jgi:hypothetical protein